MAHPNAPQDLPSEEILALLADQETLWIGTSSGLARLQNDSVTTWQVNDSGLADPMIRALAIIGDTLWIATANGLNKFNVHQKDILKHDSQMDLPRLHGGG